MINNLLIYPRVNELGFDPQPIDIGPGPLWVVAIGGLVALVACFGIGFIIKWMRDQGIREKDDTWELFKPPPQKPRDPREWTLIKIGVLLCCLLWGTAIYADYYLVNIVEMEARVFWAELEELRELQPANYTMIATYGKGIFWIKGNWTHLEFNETYFFRLETIRPSPGEGRGRSFWALEVTHIP